MISNVTAALRSRKPQLLICSGIVSQQLHIRDCKGKTLTLFVTSATFLEIDESDRMKTRAKTDVN